MPDQGQWTLFWDHQSWRGSISPVTKNGGIPELQDLRMRKRFHRIKALSFLPTDAICGSTDTLVRAMCPPRGVLVVAFISQSCCLCLVAVNRLQVFPTTHGLAKSGHFLMTRGWPMNVFRCHAGFLMFAVWPGWLFPGMAIRSIVAPAAHWEETASPGPKGRQTATPEEPAP